MDTYMTVKGQVVIPSKIRRQLGMSDGTRIQVEIDATGHRLLLTPITRAYVQQLRGRFRGKDLLAALATEKRISRKPDGAKS